MRRMSAKYIVAFAVVVCALALSAVASLREGSRLQEGTPAPAAPEGNPAFEWSYRAFQREEIPYSVISLSAQYPNGVRQVKEIETVEGSCNEYPEPDADVYPKSTQIICYYAGLGRYFKVIEKGGEYLVQRKEFEEASPEYNPPVQEFETIVRF